MKSECSSVSSAVLQDYVDGRLPAILRLRTERHIAQCPSHRAVVDAYRRQSEALHGLYDPVLSERIPQRLLDTARRPSVSHREAAVNARKARVQPRLLAAAALVTGVAILSGLGGWSLRSLRAEKASQTLVKRTFVNQAVLSFTLYGKGSQATFGFNGDTFDQLASWFKNRFNMVIAAPQLKEDGYKLSAARVLPFAFGTAGQLVYRAGNKRRIAIYFEMLPGMSNSSKSKAFPPSSTPANPDYLHQRHISAYYWHENNIAYAVVGNAGQQTLMAVVKAINSPHRSGSASAQSSKDSGTTAIKSRT